MTIKDFVIGAMSWFAIGMTFTLCFWTYESWHAGHWVNYFESANRAIDSGPNAVMHWLEGSNENKKN